MVRMFLELFSRNVPMLYRCLGVAADGGPCLYMVSGSPHLRNARSTQVPQVSPWQENGNLLDYVRMNPTANKEHLVSYVTSVRGDGASLVAI